MMLGMLGRRSFLKLFGGATVALAVGAHQFKREPVLDPWNDGLNERYEQAARDLTSYINRIYSQGHGTGRLANVGAESYALGTPTFAMSVRMPKC